MMPNFNVLVLEISEFGTISICRRYSKQNLSLAIISRYSIGTNHIFVHLFASG